MFSELCWKTRQVDFTNYLLGTILEAFRRSDLEISCSAFNYEISLSDFKVGNKATSIDWKKCEAVARVIANCPQQVESPALYYGPVGTQVIFWPPYAHLISCNIG